MEPSPEIIRSFAQRRRRRFVIPGIAIILWGLLLLSARGREPFWVKPTPLFVIFAVLAIGMLSFHIWNWRCPACNRLLGRSIRSPRFCPNCGVPLQTA